MCESNGTTECESRLTKYLRFKKKKRKVGFGESGGNEGGKAGEEDEARERTALKEKME